MNIRTDAPWGGREVRYISEIQVQGTVIYGLTTFFRLAI